jgi:hypothetical protein
MATEEERSRAIRRLKEKQAFQHNLVSYVIVNVFLTGVWALSDRGFFWPAWVMFGWGIGLAFHAWNVYGRRPITEAAIQREIDRGGN